MRSLLAIAVTVALLVAAPAAASDHARHFGAHPGKKCVKKHGKKKHGKKCRKRKAPVVPPASTPGPLPLTASEVMGQVVLKADEYCQIPERGCVDSGYYYNAPTPSDPACSSRTIYVWSCYGWNENVVPSGPLAGNTLLCDFLEVVERDGYNGIKSHQDLNFGGPPWGAGWDCQAG